MDAPCFEQDTRHIDLKSRARGDAGLDVLDRHFWRMFREHLVPDLGCVLIAAELVQPTLVLQRHPKEGDPCPVLFDPLYLDKLTEHGAGPVAQIHLEGQVLPMCEGFRETESTPPRRDIDHLPTD
jgi:hypothetical protein